MVLDPDEGIMEARRKFGNFRSGSLPPARNIQAHRDQIIPNQSDGSVLIVAGDVTGKGLQAGMLVALLVGAIRSTSDWSTDPIVILQAESAPYYRLTENNQ